MPIQVDCTECGKRLRYPDDRAGRTVTCKGCGADIELPGGRGRGAGKKKKKKSSGPPIGLLIGGGVGLVAVLAIGVFLMSGRGHRADVTATAPGSAANNPAGSHGTGNPATTASSTGTSPTSTASRGSGFKKVDLPPFKPVTDWKVRVDPNPAPLETATANSFSIKTESGFLTERSLRYPVTPSAFALVSPKDHGESPLELWNLQTGTKAGTTKGLPIGTTNFGLSPDGKLMAWFRFAGGGIGGIEVYDLSAKQSLGVLDLDGVKFNVGAVCLPSSERLVALSNVNHGMISWKLPSGEQEWNVDVGNEGRPDSHAAFSPGGHFLAILGDSRTHAIDIYDLTAGQKAGRLEMTERSPEVLGVSFSPDGKEIAAAYGQSFAKTSERIVIFDTSSGAVVSDFALPDPEARDHNRLSNKASLQWIHGNKRLLLNGVYLVDRDAKKVVYALEKPSLDFETDVVRHVVGDSTIVDWSGNQNAASLKPRQIKDQEISRAIEITAAGGLMVDARYPKLTPFDRSRAADKSNGSTGWTATPEAAPVAAPTSGPIALSSNNGRVREIEWSRGDVGIVAVRVAQEEDVTKSAITPLRSRYHSISTDKRYRSRYWTPAVECQQNWIELVNTTQQKSTRVDLEFPSELMAVSPDGSKLLVQPIDSEGRLDVLTAAGQHVVGCRPFQSESESENRQVMSATFVDDNTIVACSIDDRTVAFRIPSCEPLYRIEDGGTLAISPGHKLIATCRDKAVEVRDALTGDLRGQVSVEGTVSDLSFSPKGDRLAAVSSDKASYLTIISLANGATEILPIPQANAPLFWCGDQQILVAAPIAWTPEMIRTGSNQNPLLMQIDVSQKGVARSYSYGVKENISFGQKTFDGRCFLAGNVGKANALELVAMKLADQGGSKVDSKILVQPGAAVALKVDILTPPGVPDYAQKAKTVIDAAMQKNQLKVKPDAPIQLELSIAMNNDAKGKAMLSLFGGQGPQQHSIDRKGITVRAQYTQGGKPIWGTRVDATNDSAGLFQIPNGKDPQTALDDALWEHGLKDLDQVFPPPFVFAPEAARGSTSTPLAKAAAQK